MSNRVSHYGNGIYCELCQEVHSDTDECDHGFENKAGVQEDIDGQYYAQDSSMGHFTPHQYIEVDGMEMCAECGRVNIPEEMVDNE